MIVLVIMIWSMAKKGLHLDKKEKDQKERQEKKESRHLFPVSDSLSEDDMNNRDKTSMISVPSLSLDCPCSSIFHSFCVTSFSGPWVSRESLSVLLPVSFSLSFSLCMNRLLTPLFPFTLMPFLSIFLIHIEHAFASFRDSVPIQVFLCISIPFPDSKRISKKMRWEKKQVSCKGLPFTQYVSPSLPSTRSSLTTRMRWSREDWCNEQSNVAAIQAKQWTDETDWKTRGEREANSR